METGALLVVSSPWSITVSSTFVKIDHIKTNILPEPIVQIIILDQIGGGGNRIKSESFLVSEEIYLSILTLKNRMIFEDFSLNLFVRKIPFFFVLNSVSLNLFFMLLTLIKLSSESEILFLKSKRIIGYLWRIRWFSD